MNTKKPKYTKLVGVKFDEETMEKLNQRAFARHMDVSAVIRELVAVQLGKRDLLEAEKNVCEFRAVQIGNILENMDKEALKDNNKPEDKEDGKN